jgi:hypothetical protein
MDKKISSKEISRLSKMPEEQASREYEKRYKS